MLTKRISRTSRKPLLLLASLLVFLISIAYHYEGVGLASHNNLGWHVYNFHGCNLITYAGITYSPSIVPQATLDYYMSLAYDNNWGWDAPSVPCGTNKIGKNPSGAMFQVWVANGSWVDANCGGPSWGCVLDNGFVNWDPYGAHQHWLIIAIKDTQFGSYPLYILNHETGHVMGETDHTQCNYNGIMYQVPVGGTICSPLLSWPTTAELNDNWFHIWNGP